MLVPRPAVHCHSFAAFAHRLLDHDRELKKLSCRPARARSPRVVILRHSSTYDYAVEVCRDRPPPPAYP